MLTVLLLSVPAYATWSIVAADPATGAVGGAGTSCVGALDVGVIFAAAPGVGAIHAQAQLNRGARDEGAELLAEGRSPEEVIDAITAPDFDASAATRQYGVVDLQGRAASWTGDQALDWAGHTTGAVGGIAYAAQGNILTGAPVVDRTADAFVADTDACDLAQRLLVSMTAGRADGEGDSRCTPNGVPSDSAFLQVVGADGERLVDLSVVSTGSDDPLDALRVEFDGWRAENPCPEPAADTGAAEPADAECGCASASPAGAGLAVLLLLGGCCWSRQRPVKPRRDA